MPAYPGCPGKKAVKRICVCSNFLVLAYTGCPENEAVKWQLLLCLNPTGCPPPPISPCPYHYEYSGFLFDQSSLE